MTGDPIPIETELNEGNQVVAAPNSEKISTSEPLYTARKRVPFEVEARGKDGGVRVEGVPHPNFEVSICGFFIRVQTEREFYEEAATRKKKRPHTCSSETSTSVLRDSIVDPENTA